MRIKLSDWHYSNPLDCNLYYHTGPFKEGSMATTIPEVADALSTVLGATADEAGHDTRFVKRRSKLTGSIFVQTLTLGWLANPQAALEELCLTAATLGVRITPQGLDQRFTAEAADCLREVLAAA